MLEVGDIYFYEGSFLNDRSSGKPPGEHYCPIILDILFGESGRPQKGVVVITSHEGEFKEEEENFLKNRFGEGSYIILESGDLNLLKHRSIIKAKIYEESEESLLSGIKIDECVSEELLGKIKLAAKNHKDNPPWIKKLLV